MSGEFTGRLRERVVIEAPSDARDGIGAAVGGWVEVVRCLAAIVPEGTGAESEAQALSAMARFRGRDQGAGGNHGRAAGALARTGVGGAAADRRSGAARPDHITLRGGAVMTLDDVVQRAIAARLRAIEAELAMIEGLLVVRRADRIEVRGTAIERRRIDDPRLRFLGRMP